MYKAYTLLTVILFSLLTINGFSQDILSDEKYPVMLQYSNAEGLIKITDTDDGLKFDKIDNIRFNSCYLIAFNPVDKHFYAMTSGHKYIYKISMDGKVTYMGYVRGLKSPAYYVMEFDDKGMLYVSTNGNYMFKIDIINAKNRYFKAEGFSVNMAGNYVIDMAYDSKKGVFKSVNQNGNIMEIDIEKNRVKVFEELKLQPGGYGSIWLDTKGNVIAYYNGTGEIFKLDYKNGKTELLGTAPYKGSLNDGAGVYLLSKKEIKKLNRSTAKNNRANDTRDSATVFVVPKKEQILFNNLLRIYPNPNNGQFQVNLGTLTGKANQLNIYSMDGKLVYFTNLTNKTTYDVSINDLPSGVYTVKIMDAKDAVLSYEKMVVK